MGYLRAGFIVLAVLGGIAGAAAATAAPAAAAPVTSPAAAVRAAPTLSPGATGTTTPATTSTPTLAPSSVSQMPALTQQPDGSWVTTIYVNSAALSPKPPTYALVTTNPNAAIPNTASGGKAPASGPCANASSGTAPRLTQVCLIFTPAPGQLPAAPVSAAVVMTPATGGAPVSVTVSVHRVVTAWQYLYIPVICGAALALLLIGGMFALGLPDPSWPSDNGRRRKPRANGRPEKLRWMRLWKLEIYAGSAWSFSGSWATNVTTVATLAGTLITATGAVSELLPGVETGRFSLLLALTGGITLAAPLAFGALNYRFENVDPTSTGASIITLPAGHVAVLSGSPWTRLRERLAHKYRYSGTAVTVANPDDLLPRKEAPRRRARARARIGKNKKFRVYSDAQVTRPDGKTAPLRGSYRALLKEDERPRCEIAVPAGAKFTVSGAASVHAVTDGAAQPPAEPTVPDATAPDFVELPGEQDVIIHSGATLTVPSGGTIWVAPATATPATRAGAPASPAAAVPCLVMPGTSDIVLSAGMAVTVDPWVVVDVKDTNLAAKAADSSHASFLVRAVARAIGRQDNAKDPVPADAGHVTYAVPAARPIVLAGDAKISVLGAASLGLPAGTVIASPRPAQHEAQGATQRSPSRASSLTDWTVYPFPHSGEQVASRMSSLLLASCLTLFGTGAATGILGVLAFCLSTANLLIRSFCLVFLAATALGVWWYSTKSFMALADPTPGDSLSTADDSSFLL